MDGDERSGVAADLPASQPASFPWLPEINKEGEREGSIRGLVCQRLRREGGIRLALTLALSTRWRVVTLVWLTCYAKEAAGAEAEGSLPGVGRLTIVGERLAASYP